MAITAPAIRALVYVFSPPAVADEVFCEGTAVEVKDVEMNEVKMDEAEADDLEDLSSKTCFSVTTPTFVEQQSVEVPQHQRSLVAVPSHDMTSVIPAGHISIHFPPCRSSSVQ